ncbi:protein FAR1-RELATED SEQUENCE 5-like [Rutidosis leptorrhynchoides]|uniref:protein FAR1-RELATED SEQUENCE 5-like n=1 Tax=Rutidosis leptorrhynchoides TaxID=125765 RepID=UPI003A994E4D
MDNARVSEMEEESDVLIEEKIESAIDVDEFDVDEHIPKPGMAFDLEEEFYEFYRKYSYQIGYGVRKTGGKRAKDDCKAKISVIMNSNGRCMISRVLLEHNHILSPKKSQIQKSHRRMDSYSKRRLELNDVAGIRVNKNFHSLVIKAEGNDNLAFIEKDCRNYITKMRQLRLGVGDAEALCNYFVRMKRRNSNFFYVLDIDDEGRLQNIFCANARSRAAYELFGDVISFDSIYLTNKYSMPFSPFVGAP